jgi:6-phospho-3-hexuloisomerase
MSIHSHTSTILSELDRVLAAVSQNHADALMKMIESAHRVFVAGCERSGLMAKAFAMRLVHLGKTVFVIGDTTAAAIGPGDLLLVCSGSGNKQTLTEYMKMAVRAGARCAAVTARSQSTVAGLAEQAIVLPVPNSEQFGGSLYEQSLLIFFDSIVMAIIERDGISHDEMSARHANLE